MNKSYWKNCGWSWSTREALPRFQSLLRRHHYLGGLKPVGERLYYVAIGAGSGSPCWSLRGRQTFASSGEVDWLDGKRSRKRLGLVTNNARFLICRTVIIPIWRRG